MGKCIKWEAGWTREGWWGGGEDGGIKREEHSLEYLMGIRAIWLAPCYHPIIKVPHKVKCNTAHYISPFYITLIILLHPLQHSAALLPSPIRGVKQPSENMSSKAASTKRARNGSITATCCLRDSTTLMQKIKLNLLMMLWEYGMNPHSFLESWGHVPATVSHFNDWHEQFNPDAKWRTKHRKVSLTVTCSDDSLHSGVTH